MRQIAPCIMANYNNQGLSAKVQTSHRQWILYVLTYYIRLLYFHPTIESCSDVRRFIISPFRIFQYNILLNNQGFRTALDIFQSNIKKKIKSTCVLQTRFYYLKLLIPFWGIWKDCSEQLLMVKKNKKKRMHVDSEISAVIATDSPIIALCIFILTANPDLQIASTQKVRARFWSYHSLLARGLIRALAAGHNTGSRTHTSGDLLTINQLAS